MNIDSVISFASDNAVVDISQPKPERLRSGNPHRRCMNYFSDAGDNFNAGEWECEVGAWEVYYPAAEDEFCHILYGRMKLTDQSGGSKEFSAGDSFVIPGGFAGVWETIEPLKKLYVIAKVRD